MYKRATLLFMLNLLILNGHCQAQGETDKVRLHVLKLGRVGKEYKFITEDSTETYLRYLGKVHTASGKTYKLMNSVYIFGLSHRASNRIIVYTDQNKYVGNYYLSTIDDLPNYIKNNKLVFRNKGDDCDARLVTYVAFSKGLPKQFFRKCKNQYGDIYSFSKE